MAECPVCECDQWKQTSAALAPDGESMYVDMECEECGYEETSVEFVRTG